MCQFFSLVSDGNGKAFYCDAKERQKLKENNPKEVSPDSHTYIASLHGYIGAEEDKLNKWEYSPLTKELKADQINTKDDTKQIRSFCESLDFSQIVPELIIKPIVNSLKIIRKDDTVTKDEIKLLKEWIKVEGSVWGSVRGSVGSSVGSSVRDSVGSSVWSSVGSSVRDSVGNSVRDSIWDSVGDSVWDSVWDSIYAYISSFFNLSEWKYTEKLKYKKGTNPFQCGIDLWERGLVSSFDGTTWRLHSGPKAKIVYEYKSNN